MLKNFAIFPSSCYFYDCDFYYLSLFFKYAFQVELTETSEEPISHELTNPPEAIHEEVVETTPEQLEQEQLNSSSPSVKSSSSSSPPSDSSSIHDEEIKDGNVVNSEDEN